MGKYLYYIIAILTAGLMFAGYFVLNKFKKEKITLVYKITSFVISGLMFTWLMLAKGGYITSVFKLDSSSPFTLVDTLLGVRLTTLFVLISVWGMIIVHIISTLSPFFKFRVIHLIERLVSPIFVLIALIFLPEIIFGYLGTYKFTIMGLLYSIELGLIIAKLVNLYVFDHISLKMNKKEVLEFVLCVMGAILFT